MTAASGADRNATEPAADDKSNPGIARRRTEQAKQHTLHDRLAQEAHRVLKVAAETGSNDLNVVAHAIAANQVPLLEQDAEQLRDALRVHHPIMRSETGPFSGCRCGQVRLGQDVIAHVVEQLVRATTGQAPGGAVASP